MKQNFFFYITVLFAVFAFSGAQAKDLSKPSGRVILTVTGNITHTNTNNGTAEFDRDMLLALGVLSKKTTTPWSEGVDEYQGPLLRSVMEVVGSKSKTLSVKALNDYAALMPVQDAYDYPVILAMDMNGEPMSVRNKGPLFILYPFSDMPSLNNEVIHNRSVWQIKSINVE
ncbi:molybdopterin-dependent oxidoreductase [Marinomonas transparens]|uniref:Molybdopterin-dependent oxidoreductase n=1 Tax=Marinomonas transparens TaxID=2795388 RepID=A0A934N661_9GAMM|nr:molybdopterin-dependent oxidoreductase [Marinomonas transparens]MBJ7537746.1 molybdopterin-dependent oxidoreductase [Marinomonas transparens]